jgi:hypothetical protein
MFPTSLDPQRAPIIIFDNFNFIACEPEAFADEQGMHRFSSMHYNVKNNLSLSTTSELTSNPGKSIDMKSCNYQIIFNINTLKQFKNIK